MHIYLSYKFMKVQINVIIYSDVCWLNNGALCLCKVVKCCGCDEPYAVLQPLTSSSATLTFSHCEPGGDTQQMQHVTRNHMDKNTDKEGTLELISSILHKMPVLSSIQGMY